ncbi:unnamed protein product [Brassicogethes aeneus]|uniref:Lipase n=1 Tax=Brassicogethes aeneus TaxID=1431903 RepID=A0A9P0AQM1_BRAAE|nr:unnamed protein product [Brassicogethes aeneus]
MNLVVPGIILFISISGSKGYQGNYGLPFVEAAAMDGYVAENHEVTTDDGYILGIHRLPYKKNSTVVNKNPVLIVPGLTGTSDCFILLRENGSLAYTLVDQGYDVWLPNPRGNKHSNKHVRFDHKVDRAYWEYTMLEMGYYDMASTVDYITNVTKKDKITGIGHSQGNTLLFILLASRPEYNEKFNLFVALAPSIYLNSSDIEFFNAIGPYLQILDYFLRDFLGLYSIPDIDGLDVFCRALPGIQAFCSSLVGFIDFGINIEKIYDTDIFPMVLSHMPSGINIKVVLHYLQLIDRGEFYSYDYGDIGNMRRYGTAVPPLHSIKNISVPVALFYSHYDMLIPLSGIDRLANDLQNPILFAIQNRNYKHLFYLFSKDVKKLHPTLLKVIKEHNSY